VAILGTTISPYLFFWQSAHRVEELRGEDLGGNRAPALAERPHHEAKLKLRMSRVDVFTGMLFSQMVMFAIIAATAATLGATKGTTINSAAEAAKAL
jgi:Mn2+/Fe2+ NRAMP family transporter